MAEKVNRTLSDAEIQIRELALSASIALSNGRVLSPAEECFVAGILFEIASGQFSDTFVSLFRKAEEARKSYDPERKKTRKRGPKGSPRGEATDVEIYRIIKELRRKYERNPNGTPGFTQELSELAGKYCLSRKGIESLEVRFDKKLGKKQPSKNDKIVKSKVLFIIDN